MDHSHSTEVQQITLGSPEQKSDRKYENSLVGRTEQLSPIMHLNSSSAGANSNNTVINLQRNSERSSAGNGDVDNQKAHMAKNIRTSSPSSSNESGSMLMMKDGLMNAKKFSSDYLSFDDRKISEIKKPEARKYSEEPRHDLKIDSKISEEFSKRRSSSDLATREQNTRRQENERTRYSKASMTSLREGAQGEQERNTANSYLEKENRHDSSRRSHADLRSRKSASGSGRGSVSRGKINKAAGSVSSSESSDAVFKSKDTTAILNIGRQGAKQENKKFPSSYNFDLLNLVTDKPLRKIYSDGDYSAFRNENTKFIGENEDHLKLGREFYMYKQQLLQNPKDKASPAREDEGLRISLLKAPGVLNDENPGYQYRPVSKKQEPNFYKIENPRYSQFEVKAWIQDSRCDCKKKGVERYLKSVLEPTATSYDDEWKDTESKRCEEKWKRVIKDWFRVYTVECEHRVSSCTLDVKFKVSVDKLTEKKLKGYLQGFGKINQVLFDYSVRGIY